MTRSGPSVIIVGAGAVGLACALCLARRGARVQVIEADARALAPGLWIGAHSASAGAAGMLGAFSEALNEPASAHPDAMALRMAGLAEWNRFERDIGVRLVQRCGALNVARTAKRLDALHALADAARKVGAECAWLDGAQARAKEPHLQGDVIAALFFAEEGRIEPDAALRAIAGAAQAVDADFIADDVVGIEKIAGRWRVRLARGDARDADHVVLAPGARIASALKDAAPSLKHLRAAHGCVMRAANVHLGATVRAEDVYVAAGETASFIGGGMVFDAPASDFERALQNDLLHAAQRLLGLPAIDVTQVRFGARAMSPDWSPLIGAGGAQGLILAAGLSRNGWLLAPLCAQWVAAHIFQEDTPALSAKFSPGRFDTE